MCGGSGETGNDGPSKPQAGESGKNGNGDAGAGDTGGKVGTGGDKNGDGGTGGPVECAKGTADCDDDPSDCEADLTAVTTCGTCTNDCTADNSMAKCTNGRCSIGKCDDGFDDCDGDASNGCETALDSADDCGSCGNRCSGDQTCEMGASGLWRWAFRGGVSGDAYATLWGGILDWLSAERPDPRAALPADAIVRAGDVIRWRRGTGSDTLVTVELHRRGTARTDTLALRFGAAGALAESAPLQAGVYETRVKGGASLLLVNASRELLPRPANVRSGAVGGAAPFGDQPRLRDYHWIYLLVLAALCAEWLLRRQMGLR